MIRSLLRWPLAIAMLVVLGFLILSYRQTIKAYPSAGGAYIVTKDNFGLFWAQVAGVSRHGHAKGGKHDDQGCFQMKPGHREIPLI